MGVSTKGSRIDVEAAFSNLGVHPDEIRFLAFTLNGKIYLNVSLPFGTASSCQIFEKVATIVEWIVKYHTAIDEMSHYLDDFPLLGYSHSNTQQFMDIFINIVSKIGLLVVHHKTIGPCVILEFLGMLLDFFHQTLGITEKKRTKCLHLVCDIITAHCKRTSVTVKKIQKVTGNLNFICQAIPASHTFLSTLYSLMAPQCPGEYVHHHKRINKEIHDDMVMFEEFLHKMVPEWEHSIVRSHLVYFRQTSSRAT